MAQLDIDIKINGEEKVKQLGKDIDDIGKKSEMSKTAILGWTTAIAGAGFAVLKTVEAGAEYLKQLEETNDSLVKTVDLENDLATSFGMVGASLLEATGAWELYRETIITVTNALEALAGAEAIRRQAQAEHMKFEEEYQAMLVQNAKWKEAEHKKEMARLKKEQDEADRREEWLDQVKERFEARQKARVQAYEDELVAVDNMVDAINKQTEAEIEASQAVEDATESIEDKTEALEDATKATEEATQALQDYSSSAGTISGAEAYAKYAIGFSSTSAIGGSNDRAILDALNEIAQSSQDTNDAVRGY